MKGGNLDIGTTGGNPVLAAKGLLGSDYARKKRELMATVNEIRSTGASVEVDLPTIVVAGNQSSGKSSLIEAISGVNFPRAAGTCTRVPTEVKLKQDDVDWKCVVKVRKDSTLEADGSKPEVHFGDTITRPDKVEAVIQRAQLAILNPSVPLEKSVEYELPKEPKERPLGSTQQLAFFKDVVVLEITGPDVTDLTLVDLPGIIQNVGQNEDKSSITLIEEMVKSYISKDCLILLVITMTDDIQNQKAAQLARDADPEGKRTIGVLTKVDTLKGKTEPDRWLKVAQNLDPKATLRHGYFVTRQPDPDELADGISFDRARDIEAAFFHDQQPWKTADQKLKRRLGTKNLSAYLSDQLSQFIKEKLPEVAKQISVRYQQLDEQIDILGEQPSEDPIGALLNLLSRLEGSVNKHVEGHTGYEGFVQDVNELSAAFKQKVLVTKPTFVPHERAKDTSAQAPADKKTNTAVLSQVMGDLKARMYLDDMRLHIKGCRTWELPNELPPSALNKLINRSTSSWEHLALALLDDVMPVIKVQLEDLVQDEFGSYKYGGLWSSVNTIVNERLQIQFQTARDAIKMVVELERRPYTQNIHYLDSCQDKALAKLKEARNPTSDPSADPSKQQSLDNVLANLSYIGQSGVKPEDLAKLKPTDEYETELDLMARTEAYWKVAYKRVIDNIPRAIYHVFLSPLAGALRAALIHDLKVSGEDALAHCKEYLDEAPDVAEQRKDLGVRKERLGKAKVAIRKLKMK